MIHIITAYDGNVMFFTGISLSEHTGAGGTKVPGSFQGFWSRFFLGVSQSWLGGTPVMSNPGWGGGVTPVLARGYQRPVSAWGYPSHGRGYTYDRSPPSRTGLEYPSSPSQACGKYPNTETEQQSGYLICGGRYASFGHAGGLSC